MTDPQPLPGTAPQPLPGGENHAAIAAPATHDPNRFELCLPFTLEQECLHPNDWSNPKNFSNDAHDPGGKTMCGIIQREYDHYRKAKGELVRDVRELTQAEGHEIYLENYWEPHCATLPAGLDLCYFDASVNEGSFEANKILQVALGIHNDGVWGPATAAAVAAIKDVPVAVEAFTARREAVYRELAGFKYFGRDWLRRSAEIEGHAMAMLRTGPTREPPAAA